MSGLFTKTLRPAGGGALNRSPEPILVLWSLWELLQHSLFKSETESPVISGDSWLHELMENFSSLSDVKHKTVYRILSLVSINTTTINSVEQLILRKQVLLIQNARDSDRDYNSHHAPGACQLRVPSQSIMYRSGVPVSCRWGSVWLRPAMQKKKKRGRRRAARGRSEVRSQIKCFNGENQRLRVLSGQQRSRLEGKSWK